MKDHKDRDVLQDEFEAAMDAAGIPIYPENPFLAQIEERPPLQPEDYVTVYHPDKHWLGVLLSLSDLPLRLYTIMAGRIDPENLCDYPVEELATISETSPSEVEDALQEIVDADLAQPKEPGKYWMNPEVFWRVQVAELMKMQEELLP